MSKKWTNEELYFLRDNRHQMTAKQMAEHLGRPYGTVSSYVQHEEWQRLSTEPVVSAKKWTEDEVMLVIKQYHNIGAKEIAEITGRSEKEVDAKAASVGLVRPRTPWQPHEDEYLRKNYVNMSSTLVGKALGRTSESVKGRAKLLGVTSPTGRYRPQQKKRKIRDIVRSLSPAPMETGPKDCLDDAAAYVRCKDGTQVYRCDKFGVPMRGGAYFKYGFGSLILTSEELMAKAERKGFNPKAWQELAA